MKTDRDFMRAALAEARKGLGRTAPNPPVGAVIVKDGLIVGRGFHPKAGEPHAEVFALRAAGEQARGATCYVTLEPCSHWGKTPPCAEALIAAGVSRVVAGMLDPNPLVAGRGVKLLEAAGIAVAVGVEQAACQDLTRWYVHWMQTKRPYVIVKTAQTVDGCIATHSGDSKWITGETARAQVQALRDQVDAILVGSATVLADDPQLNCRLESGRDPLRVILDRDYEVPVTAKVLGPDCLILTAAEPATRPELLATGTTVERLELDAAGHFDWQAVLELLGARGLHALLIEGGSRVLGSIFATGLVNRWQAYVAPKLLGCGKPLVSMAAPELMSMAQRFKLVNLARVGQDALLEMEPED